MSKLNFQSNPAYSTWFDENREKLRNYSIYSKGAAIWNAAQSLAAPAVANAAKTDDLPPLPEPSPTHYQERGLSIERMEMYTADQMHTYARAAIAATAPNTAVMLTDEQRDAMQQAEYEAAQQSLKEIYPDIAGSHKVFEVSVCVESGCDIEKGEFDTMITRIMFGWVGDKDAQLVREAIWEGIGNLNLPEEGCAQFIVYESGEREDVFWNSFYRVHNVAALAAHAGQGAKA